MLVPMAVSFAFAAAGMLRGWCTSRRSGRSLAKGALVGAAAGAVGAQLGMLPINYCVFRPEHTYPLTLHLFGQQSEVNASCAAGVTVMCLGALTAIALYETIHLRYWATMRTPLRRELTPRHFRHATWLPALLLAPTIILSLVTVYLPATRMTQLSTRVARLGTDQTLPACVDNYLELTIGARGTAEVYLASGGYLFHVTHAGLLPALTRSLFYALTIVLLANVLSLGCALALHKRFAGSAIYMGLLIWPAAISPAVSGTLFVMIFSQRIGLASVVLKALGQPEIPWLQSPQLAPWIVVLAATWNILGFNTLIYINGLRAVPQNVLEAASVDGANAGQRFAQITLPYLFPTVFFAVFMNVNYTLYDMFGLIDRLTKGGPMDSTTNLIYEVYSTGIVFRDLGRAGAQSVLLLGLAALLSAVQFRTAGTIGMADRQ